jgi:hypothetical protein
MINEELQLTESQKECYRDFTAVGPHGDKWNLYLKVGAQRFRIDTEPDNADRIDWYRKMLAIALDTMIRAKAG